ncbi:MAG: dihydrodipicolinate synthase family protein, partial [Candidatus Dormibacteraceae bacterium]
MDNKLGRLLTAMITPLYSDGAVNLGAAQELATQLVRDGSDGVVVAGTTGESPTLSDDEKIELLRAVREAIPRHQVVAGTGSNDTRHTVELSQRALEAGADALLCVVPYYSKPSQEG